MNSSTPPHIPPYLIDPSTLPPPILTSEPGSFAHNTLKVRVPGILDETINLNHFPVEVRAALGDLRREIVSGRIRGLQEATPDRDFWDQISRGCIGGSWLDVPWYWAETFFYRRVLEATRYFQPGAMQGLDPYAVKKQTELAPQVAPQLVETTLRSLPVDPAERFQVLLHASLWGNRVDLSYEVARTGAAGLEDERANLLLDDSLRVWEFIERKPSPQLALIADNAGTELSMDLVLVDFLLSKKLVAQVVLHLKSQPFFVSDAMPRDVEAELNALAVGGELAQDLAVRLRHYLESGQLELRTHWFYTTCLFYFQLAEDLFADLARLDFVIVKGDANYRRLLGDAHWSPTASFQAVTQYFPAPFVALRTLKSELIVGLGEGEAEWLRALDPDWMVNGRRGVIQGKF